VFLASTAGGLTECYATGAVAGTRRNMYRAAPESEIHMPMRQIADSQKAA